MTKHLVGKADDLPPGSKHIITIGGRSIGVYNIHGAYYALRNLCPHQGAALCSGHTTAFVTSSGPGDFSYECEGEIVRCPWHQWEFDIKTGQMVVDPKMRTMTYDVSVEKYDVSVDEEDRVFVHI
ncbi:Ferredoxin subunit of nitrite reductase or a ring-hydroxylating dioxygenase [Paenibacillus sp. UNCCL117]|uniref:Rieske (2Fe-2S) protein n=1 Tax=unclassified Paenibacillus TaxID=185978 RepID=UPI000889732C|nr:MULTISPECIES: Rieske (2Fe-2S) protein [unclassified Paenibacillus]SDD57289.1 Ferredoxin subunit of nitrite reductase or a ring-hydroxylating dioxygenase [Paenibacillus sp. cl123]SFW51210.1 Ferredoxin subunit of nitrite reductase or a ring-hydroxylating dioxygenase [Paenibacillus sp. UNCCL117]